jgi:hypothetical protein
MTAVRHSARACFAMCVLAGAVMAVAGCGGVRRYQIEGIVTLDGKPERDAAITLMPAAGGRPGLGSTDADGRFVIREAGIVEGLMSGRYQVVVFKAIMSSVQTVRGPAPGPHPEDQPVPLIDIPIGSQKIERYIVPERYTRPETSGLEVTVDGPTKDLIFSLTTAP